MGENENELDDFGMGLFLNEDIDDVFKEDLDEDQDDSNNQLVDVNNENKDEDLDDPSEDKEEPDEDIDDPERVVGDDTDDDEEPEESSSPPLYKSLAIVLRDEGVLSSVDASDLENVKDVQGLADLIAKQIKAKELADLTDSQKEAVKAFRNGIDPEYFAKKNQAEQQLNNITDEVIQEDQELRRQLIYQDFINSGISESKAQRLTQLSIDSDNDIEDAKEALNAMKANLQKSYEEEIARQTKIKEDNKKAFEKRQEDLKNAILESEEIIPGYKASKEARHQVYKNMNTPVGVNPITGAEENALMKEQRENPSEFSSKLYFVHTVTKGFTDFSYFSKKGKNSAVKDLEAALSKSKHVAQGGDPSFLDDIDSSDFNLGETLNI